MVGALAVLALCYLGGIATISGALIAGVLASGGVLTQLQGGATGNASSYQFAVSGLALIVVVILYPDGISNAIRRGLSRLGPGRRAIGGRGRAPLRRSVDRRKAVAS